ncbi:golgin subfamily A member 6-like protein 2 [Xiphophorus hellerii]|uniref:golgin subfamily A member 6-like protein 2 n=1 Tax=Xiphophorus hellerii TaxID=8084 RepID=UPI0013B4225B|nr:golgin subfamily A member 6-like protein 2 [Xiphophorus hellerii]
MTDLERDFEKKEEMFDTELNPEIQEKMVALQEEHSDQKALETRKNLSQEKEEMEKAKTKECQEVQEQFEFIAAMEELENERKRLKKKYDFLKKIKEKQNEKEQNIYKMERDIKELIPNLDNDTEIILLQVKALAKEWERLKKWDIKLLAEEIKLTKSKVEVEIEKQEIHEEIATFYNVSQNLHKITMKLDERQEIIQQMQKKIKEEKEKLAREKESFQLECRLSVDEWRNLREKEKHARKKKKKLTKSKNVLKMEQKLLKKEKRGEWSKTQNLEAIFKQQDQWEMEQVTQLEKDKKESKAQIRTPEQEHMFVDFERKYQEEWKESSTVLQGIMEALQNLMVDLEKRKETERERKIPTPVEKSSVQMKKKSNKEGFSYSAGKPRCEAEGSFERKTGEMRTNQEKETTMKGVWVQMCNLFLKKAEKKPLKKQPEDRSRTSSLRASVKIPSEAHSGKSCTCGCNHKGHKKKN